MSQVVQYATRRSRAASAPLTEAEIKKQQWRKHIEEISKHVATEPIQSEDLTYHQQEWLNFRMGRPFPEPYKLRGEIVIPYRWQEQEEDTKA